MSRSSAGAWEALARPRSLVARRVEVHASIGSTSDRVRALLDAREPGGVVVVADEQTAGRGRMGRTWASPPGVNLMVSVGLRPRLRADAAWALGPAAALAARAACGTVATVGLKWPNDLVADDGRKLGGLLVEVASEGDRLRHAILGFGINVNWPRDRMPDEIRATATSLVELSGTEVDRVRLLDALLDALSAELDALEAGRSPLDRYRAACVTLGALVTVDTPTGRLEGTAAGLDPSGALLVETDRGTVSVSSGEVTRVRPVVTA